MKPVIDERKCPAQEAICLAIQACAPGAIRYVEDATAPLGGRIMIDYARCDGCGACVTGCCGKAIEMTAVG